MNNATDIIRRKWDVIVIGTGMGGATIGHALAKAGKSVLFCERGRSYLENNAALRGKHAESFFPQPDYPQPRYREILTCSGRWPDEIEDLSFPHPKYFIPYIGLGTGGSSALYGMAMERFLPADFTPRQYFPDVGDSTIPENWPITYDELHPFYVEAEKLYRVRGSVDPLRKNDLSDHLLPPPPISASSEKIYNFMLSKGLHPYRLPMACENVSGCQGSQGFLCERDCKNDSARICLAPALKNFDAHLLEECEVTKLEASRNEVTGVFCSLGGREVTLQADIVVLAAGALSTPEILLNSRATDWPNGLANDSDLVGRNLMRHYIDLYAIFPKNYQLFSGNNKEIASNFFYIHGGQKLGTVQSFGPMPPASILAADTEKDLLNSSFPWTATLLKWFKPAVTGFYEKLFSKCVVIASLMEDLPYRDNVVTVSNNNRTRLSIRYQIHDYERARIKVFREELRKILKPYRFMLIKQAENNERIAHACGTCRFGLDPKESVLDVNNCAHGISNLYVVDSSFFPSSGGTNPALTIAANALRVADHLISTGNNK